MAATPEVIDTYTVGQLRISIFAHDSLSGDGSDCSGFPTANVTIPRGWVMLGGGAFIDWEDNICTALGSPGNLLTDMIPENLSTWKVSGRDHIEPSRAIITGYCIAAQMLDGTPIPASAHEIFRASSPLSQPHPTARATLPDEFVLVGGGASTQFLPSPDGFRLLYKSIPDGMNGWLAACKDHIDPGPGKVTAFAIGLRSTFLRELGLNVIRREKTSPHAAHHPWVNFVIPDFHLVGGGAEVNWSGGGNLLTASFPQDRQTWIARGKDHITEDRATITAWAIGLV